MTLIGTGGVGKTRLAFEAARMAAGCEGFLSFAVAQLADVDGSQGLAGVARAVGQALGVVDQSSRDPVDVLAAHVQTLHEVVLVLDNAEHVLAPVGDLVGELLMSAESSSDASLRILVTSRTSLGYPGERVLLVEALQLPSLDVSIEEERAAPSDALQLLLDRVRTGRAGKDIEAWDDDAWIAVRALVHRSGGLPLAIELTAKRLSGIGPRDLLATPYLATKLSDDRHRSTRPHHQSMQTTMDLSLDRCGPLERALWGRISVFVGSWSLAAAEEVCSDDGIACDQVAEVLSGLVDASVVDLGPDGRYSQLPLLREYGQKLLEAADGTGTLRSRHLQYYERFAQQAAEQWLGPDEITYLHRVDRESSNVLAAIHYCGSDVGLVERGLALATNVNRVRGQFFFARLGESAEILEKLLDLAPATATEGRLGAAVMLGWIRLCQGAPEQAKTQLDHCRKLTRDAGALDPAPVVFLHGAYLLLADADGDFLVLLQQAVDQFHGMGVAYAGDRHMALLILALGAGFFAPPDIAEACASECLADAMEHGAPWAISWAVWAKGLALQTNAAAINPDDPSVPLNDAVALFQDSLRQQLELGDRWGSLWCAEAICWGLAKMLKQTTSTRLMYARATWLSVLLGGAIRIQERAGVAIDGLIPFGRARDEAIGTVQAVLQKAIDAGAGPPYSNAQQVYREHYERGTALPQAEVYEMALNIGQPDDAARITRPVANTLAALTDRERDVARLVAEGLTNQQVAEKLAVSRRTVETHLSGIYGKLGIHARAQLAALVAQGGV